MCGCYPRGFRAAATNLRRGQTAASTVWRQSVYPAEPGYASITAKLQTAPAIAVSAIIIDGTYEHRVFPVGHNVPREAPQAGMDVDRF